MQCRIDPDAASSASLATSDCNFLAYGSTTLRQGSKRKGRFRHTYYVRERVLRARKTATDLPHLDAADSVMMAAKYKQLT